MAADLFQRRLIIVAGKGGVGRTTVAAALAAVAARRGKRVLIVQTNAKGRLARLFGVPQIGEQMVQVAEHIHAVNTNSSAALREYGLMVLRFETVYRAVFENRMVRQLLRAVPGLHDYSLLGKTWYHTTETLPGGAPRWDVVVFDGPATGHLVTMLRIPQVILDAVPEGPLTRDARKAKELLQDPSRCAAVLVTLAEEMPTAEAIELEGALTRTLGIHVPALVVNALWPDRFSGTGGEGGDPAARILSALAPEAEEAPSAMDAPVLGPLVRRARTCRRHRALNDYYRSRLDAQIPARIKLALPFLFTADFGPAETATLSHLLEERLAGHDV